jgi:hypothetical protein
MFLALVVAVCLAFCVPTWASISITFAAVVLVAKGGGALLAKGFITGAAFAGIVWLWRDLRRKRLERSANIKWAAIPEVKEEKVKAEPEMRQRRAERLAA